MTRRIASLIALVTLASLAHAQGGYTAEKRPELGVTFQRARDYEAIPIRPSEEWVVLFYAEKEAFREQERKRFRPELRFAWIDHSNTIDEKLVAQLRAISEEAGEEFDPPKPINSFENYIEERLAQWSLGSPTEFFDRYENVGREYEMRFKNKSTPVRGHAFAFSDGERTLAAYGFCAKEDYDDQLKIWRKMIGKPKFYAPEPIDNSKLERMYSRKKYTRPDYRIKVRNQLVDGWKADDTENFILVYSTKDQPLIRIMKSELEAIRKEYVKLFPPAGELDAVSTVRICKDAAEYSKYGGPPGSGGYWSAPTEELVFYDYENVDGEMGSGKANTRLVLYHEAFHQYIYYAIGEIAPHSWFNEGMGDYFGGAVIKGGKVKKIGVNPWRIELIQAALKGHTRFRIQSFEKILNYSQPEFYNPSIIGICYAQAWSMIYFLKTSKEVKKHPVWSNILDLYFDTLQNEFARQLWGKNELDLTDEDKAIAKQKARDAAVKKAFSDVDLFALEDAWKEYTLSLKVPK